jgi:hypothetical protein
VSGAPPRSAESLERARVRGASKIGVHLPDDRYVPVRIDDLVDAIVKDTETFGAVAPELRAVLEGLERIVDREARTLQRELERAYDHFNPDRETLALGRAGDAAAERERLRRLLAYMFDKANYAALDEEQLHAAIHSASLHGMKIRVAPERVESLQLFVRGRTEQVRRVRTLRRPIKGEEREVELYRRLGVVFRMRDSKAVNIKLFREIPVSDLEALLPHAEVAMSQVDRLKIIGGGLGALGSVGWKAATVIIKGTLFATNFLWALIAAFLGLSVRSFLGYRRAKVLRTSQMTHHLYFQNVANNAGVMDLLISSIAQEELKEGLLAYSMLASAPPGSVRDADGVAERAERWLARAFDVQVDFDVSDALEELDRLGLWDDREAWRVCPPAQAIERLDAWSRARRAEHYHVRAALEGGSGV